MDAATISKQIRALGGITRKELALLADISPSTVSRIEHGTLDPTWGTLTRILQATGSQIYGDTVSSAGDTTAIAAARPIMQSLFDLVMPSFEVLFEQAPDDTSREWLTRWNRAGWLSDNPTADDMVNIAVAAGNAGAFTRRRVAQQNVSVDGGWQALVRRFDAEGIRYAVSGLTVLRADRTDAKITDPVIYVEDPWAVAERLRLPDGPPGRSILLISPSGANKLQTFTDTGVRFVSQGLGLLDAFADSGRQPDKAEGLVRTLTEAA